MSLLYIHRPFHYKVPWNPQFQLMVVYQIECPYESIKHFILFKLEFKAVIATVDLQKKKLQNFFVDDTLHKFRVYELSNLRRIKMIRLLENTP